MKNKLYLGEKQVSLTENMVFITGSPRSGTTLVGKYIGSLQNIEYHHEPSLLYMITSMVLAEALDPQAAKDILRLYLFEDFLVESVHGRKVNLRSQDDSCILNTMTWKELNRRWRDIRNRYDAMKEIESRGLRLAVKMPSIINAINFLTNTFNKSIIIILLRDGRPVVNSILQKGWMTEESLAREFWPYKISSFDGKRIPYFLQDHEAEAWSTMNEETRACMAWRKDAEEILRVRNSIQRYPNAIFIRYEDILMDPRKELTFLSDRLGHPFTALTDTLIQDTKPPKSMREQETKDAFLKEVNTVEKERFLKINQELGYSLE